MPVYNILLLLPAENEYVPDIPAVVADLDAAINDHGLLGGNFLVTGYTEDEGMFDREWTRHAKSESL